MIKDNNKAPLVPVQENNMLKRQNNGKGVKANSDDQIKVKERKNNANVSLSINLSSLIHKRFEEIDLK